jgi:hypothetical protein
MFRVFLALVASLIFASSAQAAPPKPPKSAYSFKWTGYTCALNSAQQYRTYASAEAQVYELPSGWKGKGLFRQKIKIQIDRQAGYDGDRPMWREVYGQSGTKEGDTSWFQRDVPDELGGLPDGIGFSIKTGLPGAFAIYTAKATVWLKRRYSPKAVWRYKKRSKSFECRNTQLPAANGG